MVLTISLAQIFMQTIAIREEVTAMIRKVRSKIITYANELIKKELVNRLNLSKKNPNKLFICKIRRTCKNESAEEGEMC